MQLITFLIKESRILMGLAAGIGALAGIANASLIALVSEHLKGIEQGLTEGIGLFLAICGGALVTSVISQLLMIHLAEMLTARLQTSLCQHILELPFSQWEDKGMPPMMATFREDIPSVTAALLQVPSLFINGTITLGCLLYLGYLSPLLFLALIGFLLISVLCYAFLDRWGLHQIERSRQSWDRLHRNFQALNGGLKELKLHAARKRAFFQAELVGSIDGLRQSTSTFRKFYAVLLNGVQLLYFLFMGFLIFGFPQIQQSTPGAIAGFAIVVLYIRNPVMLLVDSIPVFRQASVAIAKMREVGMFTDTTTVLHHPDDLLNGNAPTLPNFERLTLRGITHRFFHADQDRAFTLGPIETQFRAGSLNFIIGGNGSGKTTLAKLITGLYEPNDGSILFNGQVIDDSSREAYRQQFSAIFSNFYVFESFWGLDSVRLDGFAENLLKKLKLDQKVGIKDGRLSTTKLSSGQRKRLALLTCYLEDRPINLFDEWAADQDPEFKEVFYRQLLPELKAQGKTVFVISHDDRYFDVADRIVKLTEGQLENDLVVGPAGTFEAVLIPEIGTV